MSGTIAVNAVTQDNYPFIFEAFKDIVYDNGMSRLVCNELKRGSFDVPKVWVKDLETINNYLGSLSEEQRLEFCCGDQAFVDEEIERNPDAIPTTEMLGEFFDDPNWPLMYRIEKSKGN